ncbi:hypothetical protein EMIHUDRAFT_456583 [Emiliania huxleyi CCMP1516]|uniref:Nucleoporin Nup133/Nup155-like N-terminal domain-containing protein n=2 Tax=Emiliania huxleyi TaxID=2903 RepID=A0A0D3K3Q8_EMIH1|nr:hypothetical protein EMIHUDRAFT_456583 [Emiliania huxleyi CCMP1516]EOD30393.1 hypothetical protein EMIHUDRAFT_456583 [Emiliania huxleyi CCMP1516]|eukprot:XP_005782822.1 hypothetical protein EMIHUDRAFT_456583 [Emiliania huxleyi CCMP1516]
MTVTVLESQLPLVDAPPSSSSPLRSGSSRRSILVADRATCDLHVLGLDGRLRVWSQHEATLRCVRTLAPAVVPPQLAANPGAFWRHPSRTQAQLVADASGGSVAAPSLPPPLMRDPLELLAPTTPGEGRLMAVSLGYESLTALHALSPEERRALASEASMAPGHARTLSLYLDGRLQPPPEPAAASSAAEAEEEEEVAWMIPIPAAALRQPSADAGRVTHAAASPFALEVPARPDEAVVAFSFASPSAAGWASLAVWAQAAACGPQGPGMAGPGLGSFEPASLASGAVQGPSGSNLVCLGTDRGEVLLCLEAGGLAAVREALEAATQKALYAAALQSNLEARAALLRNLLRSPGLWPQVPLAPAERAQHAALGRLQQRVAALRPQLRAVAAAGKAAPPLAAPAPGGASLAGASGELGRQAQAISKLVSEVKASRSLLAEALAQA